MPSSLKFDIWLKYTQGLHLSSLSQFQWWLGVEQVGSTPQSSPVARLILSSTRRMPQDGTTISPNQKQHQEQRLYSQATTSSMMMMMMIFIPCEQNPSAPLLANPAWSRFFSFPLALSRCHQGPADGRGQRIPWGAPGWWQRLSPRQEMLCVPCVWHPLPRIRDQAHYSYPKINSQSSQAPDPCLSGILISQMVGQWLICLLGTVPQLREHQRENLDASNEK